MEKNFKIFMVEDDKNFGAVLKSYLEIHNYQVVWVDDGAIAMNRFKKDKFDICILDIMLPNIDGFEIGSEIRKVNQNIPLIFLTAKTLKADILKGFKIGADDYITKPFDSEVLLYKIKAILKRNENNISETTDISEFQIGRYLFNYKLRTILLNQNKQKLSPKEAELLKLLCLNKNKVLSREYALETIWGDCNYFTTRSMDVFITKLRKYLKDDSGVEIVNLHGSGYRLKIDGD